VPRAPPPVEGRSFAAIGSDRSCDRHFLVWVELESRWRAGADHQQTIHAIHTESQEVVGFGGLRNVEDQRVRLCPVRLGGNLAVAEQEGGSLLRPDLWTAGQCQCD